MPHFHNFYISFSIRNLGNSKTQLPSNTEIKLGYFNELFLITNVIKRNDIENTANTYDVICGTGRCSFPRGSNKLKRILARRQKKHVQHRHDLYLND